MSHAGELFVTVRVSLTDAAMCISSILFHDTYNFSWGFSYARKSQA